MSAVSRVRVVLPAVALTAAIVSGSAYAATTGLLQVQSGGYGHGVGMSQYGADGYALHGKSYQFILQHYYTGTRLGQTDPDQTIRVLLSHDGNPTFSGADSAGADSVNPGTSYTVRPNADGTLTLLYHGTVRIRHVTGSGKTRKVTYTTKPAIKSFKPLQSPLTVSGPGPLQFSGRGAYDGSITFRAQGGGVEAVESLGLDDYVAGVVPSEIPSGWPRAALEAQAVAARTYAITAGDGGGGDFDVYDDTRSQAYGGASVETAATDAAVQDTSGQVVTYAGRPVITYFFSSSGGHTESVQNVFIGDSPEPWLIGVDDPFDSAEGHNPYFHVTDQMSLAKAGEKLHGLYKGTLEGVQVLKTGTSPRVLRARVIGTRGSSTTTGVNLQKRFGLRTSWEVFQTVTASPGAAPSGTGPGTASQEQQRAQQAVQQTAPDSASQAMTNLVPLVDDLLVHAIPGLKGTVIPAPAGARVTVEMKIGHGWEAVATPTVGSSGTFNVALPGRGTYRVQFRHMITAPVTVG